MNWGGMVVSDGGVLRQRLRGQQLEGSLDASCNSKPGVCNQQAGLLSLLTSTPPSPAPASLPSGLGAGVEADEGAGGRALSRRAWGVTGRWLFIISAAPLSPAPGLLPGWFCLKLPAPVLLQSCSQIHILWLPPVQGISLACGALPGLGTAAGLLRVPSPLCWASTSHTHTQTHFPVQQQTHPF